MVAWVVNILVFLATFLAVFVANALLMQAGAGQRKRLEMELREKPREQTRRRLASQDFGQLAKAAESDKPTLMQKAAALLQESGLPITLRRVVLDTLALGATAWLICWTITKNPALATIAAALCATLPAIHVLYARNRRMSKLLSQLPDVFDVMSRMLRSGQTIPQAMQLVADEFSPPVSQEFYECYQQMNLGMNPEVALHDLAKRTRLLELKIFAVAVLVQRQTGGNLAELFEKMGTLVRERTRIRGMIQSLTSQGRMQAVILESLPVGMFVLLMIVQPTYEMVLLDHPGMIASAITLMVLGGIWINRIVHFDF